MASQNANPREHGRNHYAVSLISICWMSKFSVDRKNQVDKPTTLLVMNWHQRIALLVPNASHYQPLLRCSRFYIPVHGEQRRETCTRVSQTETWRFRVSENFLPSDNEENSKDKDLLAAGRLSKNPQISLLNYMLYLKRIIKTIYHAFERAGMLSLDR